MIEKMTRYNFILPGGEEDRFLARLGELGVVDITRSVKPVDDKSAAMLQEAEKIREAALWLSNRNFDGVIPLEVIAADPVAEVCALRDRLEELNGSLAAARKERQARLPWGNYDTAVLDELAARGFTVRWYGVARKKFDPGWAAEVPLQVVSENAGTVWFVTVSDDPDYAFPVPELPRPTGTAAQSEAEIARLESDIADVQSQLLGLKEALPEMERSNAARLAELDLYLAGKGSESAVDGYVSLLEGFAPTAEDARLAAEFDKMDVLWYREDAKTEDNPPIKLTGNRFTRMFAVLTDMYGRPKYDGFDPTPYMSVFFLLFFAFCMGDAGYGILLMIVGLALRKVKSFADMSPLVVTLGAGTTVIGLLFHTFFSMDMLQWSCIPDGVKRFMLPAKIAGYDGTMVLAIIVGIVHLCLAMIIKTYYATKNRGFLNVLGIWGWTLLIVGGVIVGGIALTGALDAKVTKWIVIALGIVSAAGIFLLNDLHRNPLKNIGSGLWETYNTVTGLLGDVLSYLRLYALGLAGSMLGFAFNSIGQMALGDGSNWITWIPFLVIVIVGHTLNLVMAALGAFVHPLRLNFLEFFKNSGYEVSPRKYAPLGSDPEKQ